MLPELPLCALDIVADALALPLLSVPLAGVCVGVKVESVAVSASKEESEGGGEEGGGRG